MGFYSLNISPQNGVNVTKDSNNVITFESSGIRLVSVSYVEDTVFVLPYNGLPNQETYNCQMLEESGMGGSYIYFVKGPNGKWTFSLPGPLPGIAFEQT